MSPVAFAWGADGKFWVVEMGDYPLGVDGKNKAGGKIKFLEKSRPDGPYDRATLFLENLSFPTGVTPWNNGVIVTCAPDIFYAEYDDNKVVKKTVLFTGFKEGNPQHRVNGLVRGLDNWLYGANGDSGGAIKSMKTGAKVNISGRDFRIKPAEGLIEAVSGPTQFGRARDDWGNWFGNNNTNPMYHFVLEDRFLKRNPHVLYPDLRLPISDHPGAAQVYPISKPLPRFNSPQALNHFTSACSAMVYRDDLFGPDFVNNTFVSEPVHNLVHREIMAAKDATFTSTRAADEQTSEFLASTDNWFRPTTIQTGPDGALWVADIYRFVIEHPEWIPKDWQAKLDLRAGHDRGRIYRVYPKGKTPRAVPRLDTLGTRDLVAALSSPNGWTRDLAQQLLIAKEDKTVTALLEDQVRTNNNPLARLHALATLKGRTETGSLASKALLADKNPAIRKYAIRECAALRSDRLEVVMGLLAQEKDSQVCIELAYALGHVDALAAGTFLAKLFEDHKDDRYVMAAVLSSIHTNNWPTFFAALIEKNSFPAHAQANLTKLVTAFGTPADRVNYVARQCARHQGKSPGEQFVALANLLDDLESGGLKAGHGLNEGGAEKNSAPLRDLLTAARTVMSDPKSSGEDKSRAARLLGREPEKWEGDRKLLTSLLVPQTEDSLQIAALKSLGRISSATTAPSLLGAWKSYSPGVRMQVLAILFARLDWTQQFLDALEKNQIHPAELDAIRRQQLLQHINPEVRRRAQGLLASAVNVDRAKVIAHYAAAVPPKGDAELGKKIFVKSCAACHQLAGIGQQVGPDLASVPDKSLEGLLVSILDPNRVVEARYLNYVATTKSGLTLTGVLYGETSTTIALAAADGKRHELLRLDLDELASTGKSPMPEGLEKDIAPKDMADLIEFLRRPTRCQVQAIRGQPAGGGQSRRQGSPQACASKRRHFW